MDESTELLVEEFVASVKSRFQDVWKQQQKLNTLEICPEETQTNSVAFSASMKRKLFLQSVEQELATWKASENKDEVLERKKDPLSSSFLLETNKDAKVNIWKRKKEFEWYERKPINADRLLPPELWLHIFQHLLPQSLSLASCVCKCWHHLIEGNEVLWRLVYIRHIGVDVSSALYSLSRREKGEKSPPSLKKNGSAPCFSNIPSAAATKRSDEKEIESEKKVDSKRSLLCATTSTSTIDYELVVDGPLDLGGTSPSKKEFQHKSWKDRCREAVQRLCGHAAGSRVLDFAMNPSQLPPSILHWACERGAIHLVRQLLEAGISPNACDIGNRGNHVPCYAGEAFAKNNLNRGSPAPSDALTSSDTAVPSLPSRSSRVEETACLSAVCVGAGSERSELPLEIAVTRGHAELARLLIAHGAVFGAHSDVVFDAAEQGRLDIVQVVWEAWRAGNTQLMPFTRFRDPVQYMLIHAVLGNRPGVSRYLIESCHADANKCLHGSTPLQLAIQRRNLEAAEVLLSCGAFVDVQDHRRRTPLHIAAGSFADGSCTESAELLLRFDADLSCTDWRGHTPLHRAARLGSDSDTLRLLLDRGAKTYVNLPDTANGWTPLHLAVCNSRGGKPGIERALLLLKAGADPTKPDRNGQTPRQVLLQRQNPCKQLLHVLQVAEWEIAGAEYDAQESEPNKYSPVSASTLHHQSL